MQRWQISIKRLFLSILFLGLAMGMSLEIAKGTSFGGGLTAIIATGAFGGASLGILLRNVGCGVLGGMSASVVALFLGIGATAAIAAFFISLYLVLRWDTRI